MKDKSKYSVVFCEFCNRPLAILKSRLNKKHGRFCSKRCERKVFSKKPFIGGKGYFSIQMLEKNKVISRTLHRAIMEAWIGRKLDRLESVHHKDGNTKNNSLENLIILKHGDHVSLHIKKHFGESCVVTGCDRPATKLNMCNSHYTMQLRDLEKYEQLTGGVL